MVAGRVGSGMASELGSMLVTEQINAMRALGTDPIKKLVVPRVLATVAMMPVLTIVADAIGIIGGLVVAVIVLHITTNLYLSRAWDALDYMDLFGGLLKPLVFGAHTCGGQLPLRSANLWRNPGRRPFDDSGRGGVFGSDSHLRPLLDAA